MLQPTPLPLKMASEGRRRFKSIGTSEPQSQQGNKEGKRKDTESHELRSSEEKHPQLSSEAMASVHSVLAQLTHAHAKVDSSISSLNRMTESLESTESHAVERARTLIHEQTEATRLDAQHKCSKLENARSSLDSAIASAQHALQCNDSFNASLALSAIRLADDAQSLDVRCYCLPNCCSSIMLDREAHLCQCDGQWVLDGKTCIWCGTQPRSNASSTDNHESQAIRSRNHEQAREEALLACAESSDIERLRGMYRREVISRVQRSARKRRSCNPCKGVQTELPETTRRAVQVDADEEPISGKELQRLRLEKERAEHERDEARYELQKLQRQLDEQSTSSNYGHDMCYSDRNTTDHQQPPSCTGENTTELRRIGEDIKQALSALQKQQQLQNGFQYAAHKDEQISPRAEASYTSIGQAERSEPSSCRETYAQPKREEAGYQHNEDPRECETDEYDYEASASNLSRLLTELEHMKRRVEISPWYTQNQSKDGSKAPTPSHNKQEESKCNQPDAEVSNPAASETCLNHIEEHRMIRQDASSNEEREERLPGARIDAFGIFKRSSNPWSKR